MSAPRVILFDIHGVLVDEPFGYAEPVEVADGIWDDENWVAYGAGRLSRAEYAQKLGITEVDFSRRIRESYLAKFRVREKMLKFVREICEKHPEVELGILSDCCLEHHEILAERTDIFKIFAKNITFLSYEMGWRKSEGAKIFELAVERARIPAGEILFVDDFSRNLEFAKKVGMRTLLAENEEQAIREIREKLADEK